MYTLRPVMTASATARIAAQCVTRSTSVVSVCSRHHCTGAGPITAITNMPCIQVLIIMLT